MLLGLLLAVSLRAAHELVGAGVLPALSRDLGGEAWAGAFFSTFSLAAAAGILLGGIAADRRGPARTFAMGLATFGAGMLATGFAPAMPLVVAARGLEGLGAGAVSCVVSAVVMRAYDDAARPRVLAWLSAAWVVPGLVAPSLSVGVADALGWRVVFLGIAPLVALAALLAIPPLWRAERAVRPSAPAAQALAAIRAPALAAALATRGLVVFAFFGVESFLPLALTEVRGAAPAEVAGLLTLSALTWTAGAFLQARANERFSPAAFARGGALVLAAGTAGAVAALCGAAPRGLALVAWAVAGLGMGVAYTAATAAAMRTSRPGSEGAVGSALGITDALAIAAATAVGGALLAQAKLAPGETPVFVVASFALAAALGLSSAWPARRLAAASC